MAIRNILKESDETLRKQSREVTVFDQRLWDLLDDMAQTMYKANGVGLAAVQVGVLKRVVVIDIGEGLIELINPVVVKTKGEVVDLEGCLSSQREYRMVPRPKKVEVKAQDRNGKFFTIKGEDLLARALCHETDHLSGRLFKDLAQRMLTPKELEELG